MLPFKRILCPTDFSDFSCEAISKAGELAAHFGAELCILHVTQSMQTAYNIDPYLGAMSWNRETCVQDLGEPAEKKLCAIIERQNLKDIEVRSLLRDGNAADEICDTAAAEKADLIVIATHGLGGWRHLVFGSVAEKVIRLAHCPVLVSHAQKPLEDQPLVAGHFASAK